jgi:hypothetical protein
MLKPEMQIQVAARNILVIHGYVVMESGKARSKVKCPVCKQAFYPGGWQGNTPGLPDLYIHHPAWGGVALPIELKAPGGTVRREQQDLKRAGVIHICRSVEEVLQTVSQFEAQFGLASNINRFIERNQQFGNQDDTTGKVSE